MPPSPVTRRSWASRSHEKSERHSSPRSPTSSSCPALLTSGTNGSTSASPPSALAATPVAPADDRPAKGVTESLREATAKYKDVNAALADGFVSTVHCESSPDGAMGIHFVNPARIEDPRILPTKPEVLL